MSRKLPKLILKDTPKYGKGVFAGEEIENGNIIYILSGKKMPGSALVNTINAGKENIDDPLQIGCRTYLDLDDFSRTFNHSCNPNAGLRGQSELFALKDIPNGQEITYDYSTTIAPTVWEMKCRCGARKCRKTIGSVLTIPRHQLEKYKQMGALQDYMQRLLKRIGDGPYKLPWYERQALARLNKKPRSNGRLERET